MGTRAAAKVSDAFNRANESPLASPWSALDVSGAGGFTPLTLTSNAVTEANDDFGASRRTGALLQANQWAAVTATTISGATASVGVVLRANATDAQLCYVTVGGVYEIARYNGGTFVHHHTSSGHAPLASGEVISAEVEGNHIKLYRDATMVAEADTDGVLTTGDPGILCYRSGTTATLDNFSAGNFVSATAPPTVWFHPDDDSDIVEMFTNMSQWATIRRKVSVFGFFGNSLYDWAAHSLSPPAEIGDNTLPNLIAQDAFRKLRGAGVSIGMEWPPTWSTEVAPQSLNAAKEMIANVAANGGTLKYISMDSPLQQYTLVKGLTQAQAVTALKTWTDGILASYPDIIFTDIACITTFTAAQILSWLDDCLAAGIPLAGFTLDALYAQGAFWTQAGLLATGLTSRSIPFNIMVNTETALNTDANYCAGTYANAQRVQAFLPTAQRLFVESFFARSTTGLFDIPANLPEGTANTHTKLLTDIATLYEVADVPLPPKLAVVGREGWRGSFRGQHRATA